MKTSILFLIHFLFTTAIIAQTPEAFKYQAVVRDNEGEIIANQNVSLQIALLKESAAGTNVYTETHSAQTNQFGLVNIEIGNGTVVSGIFENINWQNDSYFLQIEIDIAGGSNYQMMGASQLLSVPYSLGAKRTESILVVDSVAQIDSISNPVLGMTVFCKNGINQWGSVVFIWDGEKWLISDYYNKCHPEPTYPNAGPDTSNFPGMNTITLQANTPVYGDGWWSIESGTGGSFSDTTHPNTQFTGLNCEYYSLQWNIATACRTRTDQVNIDFDRITIAYAGEDQFFTDNTTSTVLEANDPVVGTGTWSVVQGQGGTFDDIHNPNSDFSGTICQSYILKWTIINVCDTSYDEVYVEFVNQPTIPNGEDQWYLPGTVTTLNGNIPQNGTGQWFISDGLGGNIVSPNNPNSIFTGVNGTVYTLLWTITTECLSLIDTVYIHFGDTWPGCGSPIKDDRDDQLYATVEIDSQCWFAESLNIGMQIDSTVDQTDNGIIEKYCHSDIDLNCDTYGGLYQWDEMMQYVTTQGVQGICPLGWHIPTKNEMWNLATFLGGQYDAGGKMKEAGTEHWYPPNTGATNESGFTGLPAGVFLGYYANLGFSNYLWTSTLKDTDESYYYQLNHDDDTFRQWYYYKVRGHSVRCLKD